MINLAELITEKLDTATDDFSIGEYTIPLIALTGDFKQLVENAEDSYPAAIVYGLRDNTEPTFLSKPLVLSKGYSFDDVLLIIEDQGFADDDLKAIAEKVLTLSDMKELIEVEEEPEGDEEVLIDGDNLTNEQLNEPLSTYQP